MTDLQPSWGEPMPHHDGPAAQALLDESLNLASKNLQAALAKPALSVGSQQYCVPSCVPMLEATPDSTQVAQQMIQVLLAIADPTVLVADLAYRLGTVLQADICLVLTPGESQPGWQRTVWQREMLNPESRDAHSAQKPSDPILDTLERFLLQQVPGCSAAQTEFQPTAIALPTHFSASLEESDDSTDPSVLALPIWSKGQLIGRVGLVRSGVQPWTAREWVTLQALTDPIALVIARAIALFRQRYQQQQQALLNCLTLAIHQSCALPQVFQVAVEGMTQILQIDQATVLLLHYGEGAAQVRFQVATAWNQMTKSDSTQTYPDFHLTDCRLCQRAFTLQPVAIADWNTLPTAEQAHPLAPIFSPPTYPALLIVPLENRGIVLGLLVLQHSQARSWTTEDVELVDLIAAQLSTAILKTQTLRQVQAMVEERTSQLQRSLEVQAKLYDTTRRHIDQLQHLNQLKDAFLSSVSHELLTPLTSMRLAIRMLRQAELSSDRRGQYLDILEQQCLQETDLIRDLLALQQMQTQPSPLAVQRIHLQSLIEQVVLRFQEKRHQREIALVLALPKRPVYVHSDFDSLNRILSELLTNALKYAQPKTEIHLSLELKRQIPARQVELTLVNYGLGITPEELPHIFEQFRRGQQATQQAIQGTGLGLTLVKYLVQAIHGAIAVTSEPWPDHPAWHQTCFALTLPQHIAPSA